MPENDKPVDSVKSIIKGCIQNRKADQYRLYAMFSKQMFGVCLRYAASYDEAQDILQEGFVKVFKSLPSFRGKGSLEGWIKKIFVNTAIEKFRARIYHLPLEEFADYEEYVNHNLGSQALHTRDILAFVQKLPMQYRIVFNLYALEGYSHKEIGEALRISESTSRSNLARARMLLKEKLNKEKEILYKAI
ncbi:MAG: RNA polymerase sigma factor [Bacteroidia bacterium]|nr:MAG: RNA polymerase sigma factor [Bacteroidia bacterium]